MNTKRIIWGGIATVCFTTLAISAYLAPSLPSSINIDTMMASPSQMPPFGADMQGRPLTEYATQGARVVAIPSLIAGMLVTVLATIGGLARCMERPLLNALIQSASELVGALPRMVVILVAALMLPSDWRGLMPLAVVWAILAAPGAMDEAGAAAARLGGTRFVEALRAHGFSGFRIYAIHIIAYNLRPVVIRQGAEIMMQVAFLEVALSYLAVKSERPSFTHPDSLRSWADLLNMGYVGLVVDGVPMLHALWLGIGLIALVVLTATAISKMVEAR